MVGNILASPGTGNVDAWANLTCAPSFPGLLGILASVDTVGWCDREGGLTKEERATFKAHGFKVWQRQRTFKDRHGRKHKRADVRLSRVGRQLPTLLQWLAQRPARPNRLDIAYDLHFDTWEDMLRAASRMQWQLVLDRAPKARRIRYGYVNTALKDFRGKRQPARSAMVYDRDPVLRIELRFAGPANVEACQPHGIYDTDPHLWLRNFRWLVLRRRKAASAGYRRSPSYGMYGVAVRLMNDPGTYAAKHLTTTCPFDLDGIDVRWE